MQQNGIGADQITQVRGFADQRLLKPEAPLDPANRRISLIVLYQQDTSGPTAADAATTPPKGADANSGGATPQESNAEPGASSANKPVSPATSTKNDATKPAPKQSVNPALSMDEVRGAVEKMNGKTSAPTSPPAAAPDKSKEKPQN